MVVRLLLYTFILLFPSLSYSLEGVIQVLEAPLFKAPKPNSKIVQFKRKGDIIKIHPSEAIENDFPDFESDKFYNLEPDKDPLFKDRGIYSPKPFYTYYKTISRNGEVAYILKNHVNIFTKDKREFLNITPKHDLTDYRLQEPLPEGYPLLKKTKTITQLQLITGIPNYSPYPYSSEIIDTEYAMVKEFQFVMANRKKIEGSDRFYFGLYTGLHISNINYLTNDYKAQQENVRVSIGPITSYDLYRTKKRIFNIFTSIQYNIIDQMNITLAGDFAEKESRTFYSFFSFTHSLGFSYQYLNAIFSNDLFIGMTSKFHLPKLYQTSTTSNESDYWGDQTGATSYSQSFRTEVNFFIGLQRHF